MVSWQVHRGAGIQRWGHVAVHVPERNSVYCFGGITYDSEEKMTVYILDTGTYKWRQVPRGSTGETKYDVTPSARYYHTAVRHHGKVYIWGGLNFMNTVDDKLYCFDLENQCWTRITVCGDSPLTRRGHSACMIKGRMVVFGGCVENYPSNELANLDLETYTWKSAQPEDVSLVPARSYHTACAIDEMMYVIGGWGGDTRIGQNKLVQVYNARTHKWHTPPVTGQIPTPRNGHSAATYIDQIFIYGGTTDNERKNELFSFNTVTNQWCKLRPSDPSPPTLKAHTCVSVDYSLLIFGGTVDVLVAYNDLARLDIRQKTLDEKEASKHMTFK